MPKANCASWHSCYTFLYDRSGPGMGALSFVVGRASARQPLGGGPHAWADATDHRSSYCRARAGFGSRAVHPVAARTASNRGGANLSRTHGLWHSLPTPGSGRLPVKPALRAGRSALRRARLLAPRYYRRSWQVFGNGTQWGRSAATRIARRAPAFMPGGSERMVDTGVTSRSMLAILLFEIVVSGCGG